MLNTFVVEDSFQMLSLIHYCKRQMVSKVPRTRHTSVVILSVSIKAFRYFKEKFQCAKILKKEIMQRTLQKKILILILKFVRLLARSCSVLLWHQGSTWIKMSSFRAIKLHVCASLSVSSSQVVASVRAIQSCSASFLYLKVILKCLIKIIFKALWCGLVSRTEFPCCKC